MPEPTSCCRARSGYRDRCDLLVGLDDLHVLDGARDDGGGLVVDVESAPGPVGCPACGVLARGHGRREVGLVDAPAFGRPARLVWRKRRWVCLEAACPVGVFTEQDEAIARPRGPVDGAGVPVGHCRAAAGAGLDPRSGAPTRNYVVHGVGLDPAAAAGGGRRTRPGSRASRSLGWMSTCGTTCPPGLSSRVDEGRRS